MLDLVPLVWWQRLADGDTARNYDATFKLATSLVQDGGTRVTVVIPRRAGVLVRARLAARAAGVRVSADRVASATITLRFSAD